ncbi:MAG: helix-turn-helix transcriptional regulator [Pseudomonadota bacterium]
MKKEDKFPIQAGKNIKKLRLKAGLTQEDMEDYGISYKHYQKIETGKTNTTLRVLFKLANAFKCKYKDLL